MPKSSRMVRFALAATVATATPALATEQLLTSFPPRAYRPFMLSRSLG